MHCFGWKLLVKLKVLNFDESEFLNYHHHSQLPVLITLEYFPSPSTNFSLNLHRGKIYASHKSPRQQQQQHHRKKVSTFKNADELINFSFSLSLARASLREENEGENQKNKNTSLSLLFRV
jgi:hypothetical protein